MAPKILCFAICIVIFFYTTQSLPAPLFSVTTSTPTTTTLTTADAIVFPPSTTTVTFGLTLIGTPTISSFTLLPVIFPFNSLDWNVTAMTSLTYSNTTSVTVSAVYIPPPGIIGVDNAPFLFYGLTPVPREEVELTFTLSTSVPATAAAGTTYTYPVLPVYPPPTSLTNIPVDPTSPSDYQTNAVSTQDQSGGTVSQAGGGSNSAVGSAALTASGAQVLSWSVVAKVAVCLGLWFVFKF